MGVSSDNGANADLAAAMSGGSTFEQRLADLAAAKRSLDEAYTNLGLGNSAKAAVDAAEKAKAEAEAFLANAKADAKAIVLKAQEDAEKITSAAKQSTYEFTNAERQKIEAQKAEAAELRAKAKADADDAAKKLLEAKAGMENADKVFAAAVTREAAAEAAAAAYSAGIEELKSIREKVSAVLKELANV